MHIYAMSNEWASIEAMLDGTGGEVTDEIEVAIAALEVAERDLIDGIALLIADAQAEAAAFRDELDRLKRRHGIAMNRADRLKGYLLGYLQGRGIDRYDTGLRRVRVQRNSVPTITCTATEIPESYRLVTVALDKQRVAREVAAGLSPPEGVRAEYGSHLRIE